jgi:hypothetical protein
MTEGHIAMDIIVPTTYKPLPGAFNVLFTMYEMHDIPEEWKSKIKQADLVITHCRHNQRIFQQYTSAPVEVCPEGVDPAVYHYFDRKPPGEKEFFNEKRIREEGIEILPDLERNLNIIARELNISLATD